tara:strand:- start:247 stop:420 length:174 start_codon:yes stop_codon:yes gene_type:complete
MAKKNLKKMTEVEKLHNEYLELKLKNSTGALKDTHKLSEIRKDIARIKTKERMSNTK